MTIDQVVVDNFFISVLNCLGNLAMIQFYRVVSW